MNPEYSDILTELESWYSRPNGQYLLETLRQNIDSYLDTAFGYHILQIGVTRHHPLFEHSSVNHRIYAAQRAGEAIGLVAHSDELPLESDSIDILIAHHSLEFEANPHQALREMQRVLAPQGHLMIIGFNPYSVSGGAAYIKGLSSRSPWHQHEPVAAHRLTDWLHLLGCEVQEKSYLYTVPPMGSGKLRELSTRCDSWLRGHNFPLGGLYVLHAIKQVSGLNRPRRRVRPASERLIGLAVPKPSAVPSPSPSISITTTPTPRHGDTAA